MWLVRRGGLVLRRFGREYRRSEGLPLLPRHRQAPRPRRGAATLPAGDRGAGQQPGTECQRTASWVVPLVHGRNSRRVVPIARRGVPGKPPWAVGTTLLAITRRRPRRPVGRGDSACQVTGLMKGAAGRAAPAPVSPGLPACGHLPGTRSAAPARQTTSAAVPARGFASCRARAGP